MMRKKTECLTPAEARTTYYFKTMLAEILGLLAEHFRGETTLNHLRIGNFIGLRSLYEGRPTNNSEIAEALGISRPTVSRIVGDFIRGGWVEEYPHPDDGRRRLLVIKSDHRDADQFERAVRRVLNDMLDRYDSGDLLKVDPDKRSFGANSTAR